MQSAGFQIWPLNGEEPLKYGSRQKRKGLVPGYCEYCGYKKFVSKHRIKPGCEGGKYLPGNVIGLCPTHHGEADAGLIPRAILFDIVHNRLRQQNGST